MPLVIRSTLCYDAAHIQRASGLAADNVGWYEGSPEKGGKLVELTAQEQAILQAYAVGWTTEQVAAACGLSPAAVQTHLAAIQRKLNARSKLEAVLIALRSGLISQPAPIQPPLIIDRVLEADRQLAIC